jgi:hypothetical protein
VKEKNIKIEIEIEKKIEKILIDSVSERTMTQIYHIAKSVFTIMRRDNVIILR